MTTANSLKGKALVTGASAGIGAIYADRLARRNYDLILVARDVTRLEALAQRISKETGRTVEVAPADLTKPGDLARLEALLKKDKGITLLLNNAGIAAEKNFAESAAEDLERMITLNVTALTRLSNAIASEFVARKSGTLINIASVVALMPGRFNATYAASKAFVLALTRTIATELEPHGVQVQVVLPGATKTEIWEKSGMDLSVFPEGVVMSAEDMVDAALAGLDQKEVVTIPALPETKQWDAMESAREAMLPNLSRSQPGARYL